MSKIVATFKVFPKDIDIDLNNLRATITNSLPKGASVYKFQEEPIAFGLIALIIHVVLPDEEGLMDKVESSIKAIDNISQMETVMVRLV
jgi:translation elongation factor aEF-1 beta